MILDRHEYITGKDGKTAGSERVAGTMPRSTSAS